MTADERELYCAACANTIQTARCPCTPSERHALLRNAEGRGASIWICWSSFSQSSRRLLSWHHHSSAICNAVESMTFKRSWFH